VIDWLAQLPEEQRSEVIRGAFARVASTQDGAIMVSVLFEQLYFFRRCDTPEQTALSNFAKWLLNFFGPEVQSQVMTGIIVSARQAGVIKAVPDGEKNGD